MGRSVSEVLIHAAPYFNRRTIQAIRKPPNHWELSGCTRTGANTELSPVYRNAAAELYQDFVATQVPEQPRGPRSTHVPEASLSFI
jgi:hypothetical protein